LNISVQDDSAVDVACSSPDGLDEAAFVSEETFFVGVKDEYGSYFRDV
jgi:hypothetical protein